MLQGVHSIFGKTLRKKHLIAALALIVLAAASVATTLAYVSHSSNSVRNEFGPSDISCEIIETVESGVKSSVTVKNTGKTAAFIRTAVIANTVDDDGSITGAADVSDDLAGSGWVRSGMYYYYTSPVEPQEETGELLKNSIELDGIQVTILAEAIQAQPAAAAVNAWGVNPANLSGS